MKLQNVLTVLASAGVTVAVTLALFAPRSDGNAQAGPAVKPVIASPQLTAQGCTFTLKTDRETYEAGQTPALEVTASNPTNNPVTATVYVNVMATAPTSPMSRMMAMPRILSSQEYAFQLQPGEKKSLSAPCKAALPGGQSVTMILSDRQSAVLGLATSVNRQFNGGPNLNQTNTAGLNGQRPPHGQPLGQ